MVQFVSMSSCDVASLNTLTMVFMCVVTTSYLRNLDIQFENMGVYTNLKCGLGFVAPVLWVCEKTSLAPISL